MGGHGDGVWKRYIELEKQRTKVDSGIEEKEVEIEDLKSEMRDAKEEEDRIPNEDDYRYGEDPDLEEGKGFNQIAQIQNCCLICNSLTLIVVQ